MSHQYMVLGIAVPLNQSKAIMLLSEPVSETFSQVMVIA